MTTAGTGKIGAIVLLAGMACAQTPVRPDEMSADAHRKEASKVSEEAGAESKAAEAPLPNLVANPTGVPQGYYSPVNKYGPSTEHAAKAERLSRHAEQHLAAASYLEASEEAECKGVPKAVRAACPLLGPVTSIDDVAGGVRVTFAEGANVEGITAQIRCHFAYARTRAYEGVPSCPLYVRGVEVVRGASARTLDLVSKDARVAGEVRARAREEAVVVHGGTP